MPTSYTAAQIAEQVQGEVLGDATTPLTGLAPADSAKAGDLTFAEKEAHFLAAEQSAASAILVSGPITGQPPQTSDLRRVAMAVKEVPVIANTGINIDNVEEVMSIAAGVVIGTHFKVDGITWNPVDPARVSRFMDRVAALP